jgi:TraM recognition site of TraD and TraG
MSNPTYPDPARPAPARTRAPRTDPPANPGRRGLALVPAGHPGRATRKPLGTPAGQPPGSAMVGLGVADARHHLHVLGLTGSGKSTWLAGQALAEAAAGRGVVLLDCQGDLARHVIARLPAQAAGRVVLLDPDETTAPPAWNVLAPDTGADTGGGAAGGSGAAAQSRAAEWAAENVVTVFRRLSGGVWGPRMDDLMRAACLTLARRPGSTIADIVPLLTDSGFRHQLLTRHGEPEGLHGYWHGHHELTPGQRAQLCGPVLARLRSVLARRFARDLLACPAATLDLSAILDGGILIARLPKGQIGEDTARLVGSLLLSGLWSAATRRAHLPPEHRRDATIIVDECHNFLHLPVGMDDALAESRGYRISLVLAHQHLAQLPADVAHAVDANARNKIFFTVSPQDARHLARHTTPVFDEWDLAARPGFHASVRVLHHGQAVPAFSIASLPLPDPPPGRAALIRHAARVNAGLTAARRRHARQHLRLTGTAAGDAAGDPANGRGIGWAGVGDSRGG